MRPPLWSSDQSLWLQNGNVFDSCEVRTEFICRVEKNRPLLWSSGQSSWLQIGDVLFPVRYERNVYTRMLCRRK
jgi:hypothetical protein